MSFIESLTVGLFCMAVVFAMLLLLFVVISLVGRIIRASKKPQDEKEGGLK